MKDLRDILLTAITGAVLAYGSALFPAHSPSLPLMERLGAQALFILGLAALSAWFAATISLFVHRHTPALRRHRFTLGGRVSSAIVFLVPFGAVVSPTIANLIGPRPSPALFSSLFSWRLRDNMPWMMHYLPPQSMRAHTQEWLLAMGACQYAILGSLLAMTATSVLSRLNYYSVTLLIGMTLTVYSIVSCWEM